MTSLTAEEAVEILIEQAEIINEPFFREAADLITRQAEEIARLDAECERAWEAYRIAQDQAMKNGEAAIALRASSHNSSTP